MALNYVWIGFFIIGFIVAIIKLIVLGDMNVFNLMMADLFDSAKTGFTISLGLTGMMALWLGIMKIGEGAGMVNLFAKGVQPFFRTIFKGVPKDHPAYGSVAMNFSANLLGLDNAATPLGLKAMEDLQGLNQEKDKASDAQIMFLVLNTAGITLIPSSVIAIRQTMAVEQGLKNFNAADVFLPILISTFIAFTAGIIITSLVQKINFLKGPVLIFILGFGGLIFGVSYWLRQYPPEIMGQYIALIGSLVILAIIMTFITAGLVKRLNVYNLFVEGAKEGFNVAIKIIPYLIAMLAAISVFRTSGCMDFLTSGIGHIVAFFGLNTDFVPALPVALMKPLSGSGARGLMVDVMQTYGVHSFVGSLASVLQGTTETTFYVLAVYFGSVNIKNTRHALACGLIADAIGMISAILLAYLFFH
jgi:spore maturation protein SpmA